MILSLKFLHLYTKDISKRIIRHFAASQASSTIIADVYTARVKEGKLKYDEKQYKIAQHLDFILRDFVKYSRASTSTSFSNLFTRFFVNQNFNATSTSKPKGIYLHGAVGVV